MRHQVAILQKRLEAISDGTGGHGLCGHGISGHGSSGTGASVSSQLKAWNTPTQEKAITTFLGSEASFRLFETMSAKIVKLLGQLIRDPKASRKMLGKASHTDTERAMFDRLKRFTANLDAKTTKSTFAERFRFFHEKRDRDVCLKNLSVWNKRLGKLIPDAQTQVPDHGRTYDLLKTPFYRSLVGTPQVVRQVTSDLHSALSKCWTCGCPAGHEARLCLNIEYALEHPGTDVPLAFDMLVSASHAQQSDSWREGTIFFKLATAPRKDSDIKLQDLCNSLDISISGYRLRVLMEHMTGQESLWKLEPKPKRLSFHKEDPVPLRGLLDNHHVMSRAEKCGLGLIVSYSLLLFHDSPWNTTPWEKNNLSFFYRTADEPDYLRPFITARFEKGDTEIGKGINVFHRNYNIMMLGILLIEIFMQAKIERFRTEQEREEVDPKTESNINLKVAYRVVSKMDDAPHRAAIKACLELSWVPEGSKVLLEDLDVRNGLFVHVIEPLKREQGYSS